MNKIDYHIQIVLTSDNIMEYTDELWKDAVGFEGYINNLLGVYENIVNDKLAFSEFDSNKECEIIIIYEDFCSKNNDELIEKEIRCLWKPYSGPYQSRTTPCSKPGFTSRRPCISLY